MALNSTSDVLDVLLKGIRDSSENNLLPAEIIHLTSAFLSTRSDSTTVRPKAYLVLSAFCQGARAARGKESDATKIITKTFGQATLQYLGETDETSLLTGISFLTALFQVDSQAACSIFAEDGLVENLTDSIDLSPSDVLSQNLAHLLGQACGHKSCRAIMSPQIVRWLEFKSGQTRDPILRGAAAVALIKMSRGAASDGPENGTPEVKIERSDGLASMMVEIVISEQTSSAVDAIEGLGYLSMEPTVKELLSKDKVFLKKLFALVPFQKSSSSTASNDSNPTLVYGVLVIICNLVAYRPRLSEEQKQVENLKRMTKTGKGRAVAPEAVSSLENDDHVKARIHSVMEAGALSVFSAAVSSTASLGVRVNVGKSLLSIVEERGNRGEVLQAGGAKVLQIIVRKGLASAGGTSNDHSNVLDLEPIQALAKLAITSSPVQVFGPNVGAMYDAIRPFSILLQHPSSNLLQRFEAVMALTNLASHSADIASRIASAEGLLNKVELLLLEEHTLVRRASMELICNLIAGSDVTFERYGGEGESPNSTSKIHILLALSDVDDLPTRLAASGALATLTSAPSVCRALIELQFERHRFLPIMTQLIDPSAVPAMEHQQDQPLQTHPGLVHRGIVCIRNVFHNINDDRTRETIMKEAKEAGLLEALVQLVKQDGIAKDPILQQAAEALTLLAPVNRS
ncbi:ARM repeat-containing protein [Phlegmacium glaucopus]|nr:ARM repeat-containing protein [Phlegmacium glaucopus]